MIYKNNTIDNEFLTILRKYVEDRNLKQVDLAKLSNTSQPAISSILCGKMQCGAILANKLAKGLNLNRCEKAIFIDAAGRQKWKGISRGIDHNIVECVKASVKERFERLGLGIKAVTLLDKSEDEDCKSVCIVTDDSKVYKMSFNFTQLG